MGHSQSSCVFSNFDNVTWTHWIMGQNMNAQIVAMNYMVMKTHAGGFLMSEVHCHKLNGRIIGQTNVMFEILCMYASSWFHCNESNEVCCVTNQYHQHCHLLSLFQFFSNWKYIPKKKCVIQKAAFNPLCTRDSMCRQKSGPTLPVAQLMVCLMPLLILMQ